MDDNILPLDMTIYGAVHQHEVRKATGPLTPPNLIWQGVYTVKYKKITGPVPVTQCTLITYGVFFCLWIPVARVDSADSRSKNLSLTSLPDDAAYSKILRLLRVLYKLNGLAESHLKLPDSAFMNNKLTAKLTRQLEEPMIVARYVSEF